MELSKKFLTPGLLNEYTMQRNEVVMLFKGSMKIYLFYKKYSSSYQDLPGL